MEKNEPTDCGSAHRDSEWFVPKFGPPSFRSLVGLLFLPYTGMVLSFSVIGSVLAKHLYFDRVVAIAVIYFLGLGIGAHALDAVGSKGVKPWGKVLTRGQLWLTAILALVAAYLIAAYYIIHYVPLLASVALCEGFFVLAYNLEWFRGRFHKDRWFAFSWGFLPVLAGYMMQTNKITIESVMVAVSTSLFSLVEIKASRPYRDLRRRSERLGEEEKSLVMRYEAILKGISLGTILLGAGLLIWRVVG